MLTFNLKKEWFEKIKRGEKTHEYREVKPYWEKRIFNFLNNNFPASLNCCFRKGYSRDGELLARIINISRVNGLNTDLKINKPVYDIEFELLN